MEKEQPLPLFELLLSLSEITDRINPAISNHHKHVATIAYRLGIAYGLPEDRLQHLVIAAALHDIGAFSLAEKMRLLDFEVKNSNQHSELGYLLLRTFSPIAESAKIVRYHHQPWDENEKFLDTQGGIPEESHLLHLADRISVLIRPGRDILVQVPDLRHKILNKSGSMFMPGAVEAFRSISSYEDFWLDIIFLPLNVTLSAAIQQERVILSHKTYSELAELFRRVIDFRTHFTATHSSGVAASAAALSKLADFAEEDADKMHMAGYLHDLGKLAIPSEILEKNAALTKDETFVMHSHSYHTHRILEPLQAFDTIRDWASLHHEKLDGTGYPFHFTNKKLSTGARVMAVADIFTALTEDRPYRNGLSEEETLQILRRMARSNAIDHDLVDLLAKNFEGINQIRIMAQSSAFEDFRRFLNHSD